MSDKYEIELSEPSVSHCECCGGLNVRLTRFVSRAGEAVAIYYAANGLGVELDLPVALGTGVQVHIPDPMTTASVSADARR